MARLNKNLGRLAIAGLLCCAGAGCNKGTSLPKTSADTFAAAQPALKQAWEMATASSQKNDYLGATTNLMLLQGQESALSAEQVKAVEDLWAAMGNRIFAAAEKGDAEAVKAMQEIRKVRTR